MKSLTALFIACVIAGTIILNGCAMKAIDYYNEGRTQLNIYNCASDTSFKRASEMEFTDEGNWYPIYMMSLGLSRLYCEEYAGALKAFQTVDQFTVKKSQVSDAAKVGEFIKSSSRRMYELSDREETLLHYYIGIANYQLGNYEDALIELKKVDYIAQGTYAALPLSSLTRSLIYLKLGQVDNAMVGIRKAIEVDPKSALAYKLAVLYAPSETDKEFFRRSLQEKFNITFVPPAPDEKPTLVFYEFDSKYEPEYTLKTSYGGNTSAASFVDAVDPDFDFGKFVGGVMKEMASGVARDVASRATCGLSSIFTGGNERDERGWHTLPRYFIGDVAYVREGPTDSRIRVLDGDDLKKERAFVITHSGVFNVRF
jgi:tetratricopeptide (TPR) repeat protein